MPKTFEHTTGATFPSIDGLGAAEVAPQAEFPQDSFARRQFEAAGLAAVAEKVAAGSDLCLAEAIALSRIGLVLLAKMVQIRPKSSSACSAAAGCLPIDRVASRPELPRYVGQSLADWDTFCRTLIAMRGDLSSSGSARAWYPILGQPLDQERGCEDDFTGVDVLRAIALARLLLPAEVEVRAPLATLGAKLAQVALDFGATHLGYAAVDGQLPDDPLVAPAAMLDELLNGCLRTLPRDGPKQP